jgi:hypothetical protein
MTLANGGPFVYKRSVTKLLLVQSHPDFAGIRTVVVALNSHAMRTELHVWRGSAKRGTLAAARLTQRDRTPGPRHLWSYEVHQHASSRIHTYHNLLSVK